ncbi:MAG: hypothetical protein ACKVS6_09595 [Planctomycetota bacterium]
MGIIRDLWNDPDPIKWFIFGGIGLSLALGGALYWQNGKVAQLQENIISFQRTPKNAGDIAPTGSLQEINDKTDQLAGMFKQVEDDPFANLDEDPSSGASSYVIRSGTGAKIPDPKVSTSAGRGGSSYVDTEINVSFPGQKAFPRNNIRVFLYNMERSPLVVCTHLALNPGDRNHKNGQTLPPDGTDQWTLESKFTVRRPKVQAPK